MIRNGEVLTANYVDSDGLGEVFAEHREDGDWDVVQPDSWWWRFPDEAFRLRFVVLP